MPFVALLLGNTVGAFALIDRLGRRPVLIGGMGVMCASLLIAGAATLADPRTGGLSVASIVCYMFAFGASWGYGAWLYIPEIMPLRVRGKAVGLCTFINWGPANMLSAFLTPWMLQPTVLGAGGTLAFFGGIAALAVPFAVLCLPETMGLPLEQVQPLFAFEGLSGLGRFVRGNLAHGGGARWPVAAPRVGTLAVEQSRL